MSNRTILEFNHDFGFRIDEDPQGFIDAVKEMIRAGVNENPCRTTEMLRRYGVTTSPTHHHSDNATVTLSTGERQYFARTF